MLQTKKIIIVFLTLCMLFGFCGCLSDGEGQGKAKAPGEKAEVTAQMEKRISETVLEEEGFAGGCEAHKVLYAEKGDMNGENADTCTTVYLYTLFGTFERKDAKAELQSGGLQACAITLDKNGDEYIIKSYWVPRDGADHAKDLKANFPTPAYEAWEQIEQTAETHNAVVAELEEEINRNFA